METTQTVNESERSVRGGTGAGRGSTTVGDGAAADESVGVTVERLYREVVGDADDPGDGVRLTPEQESEVVLEAVCEALFEESSFVFEESAVKENLDEILLLLVAHRTSDTHGKGLMGDLATLFDTHLSPGTVYPRLHELEEEGLLRVQELVRTKEYVVDDGDALTDQVEAAMEQHLVLGLFFRQALARLD
jgi:hypothetical protein